jgi:hypothetical protein
MGQHVYDGTESISLRCGGNHDDGSSGSCVHVSPSLETSTGLAYAKDLGTPPRHYNQIIRQIAKAQANDIAESAVSGRSLHTCQIRARSSDWQQPWTRVVA